MRFEYDTGYQYTLIPSTSVHDQDVEVSPERIEVNIHLVPHGYQSSRHLIGPGSARHIRSVEILMKIDDPHSGSGQLTFHSNDIGRALAA